MSHALAPSNSTSDEAFDRLPSLSFSLWKRSALTVPSGRKRGMRKHDSPLGACASTRNASLIGADMNHLCPVSTYSRPGPPPCTGTALVVLARTSVPPWRSVMPMPTVMPVLSIAGLNAGSYVRDRMRGSHSSARSACCSSAGTQALVIVIGQQCPASICAAM